MAGSELASRWDFNSMTFLQLEREARVQGLLGPTQTNHLSEWKLRLKLKIKARQKRVAAGLPAEANFVTLGNSHEDEAKNEAKNEDEEEEREKIILTRNNGITMRF
jgi:hypothetical protein